MKIIDLRNSILDTNTPISDLDLDNKNMLRFYPKVPGIFIPEITVNEYFKCVKNSKEGYSAMIELESLLVSAGIFKPKQHFNEITLAVFFLIHEEGHWIYLKNEYLSQGKSYIEYNDDYSKLHNYCVDVLSAQCANSSNEDEKHTRWAKIYRNNPFEEAADQHAIWKIKKDLTIRDIFS